MASYAVTDDTSGWSEVGGSDIPSSALPPTVLGSDVSGDSVVENPPTPPTAPRPRPSVVQSDSTKGTPPPKHGIWSGRAAIAPHIWESKAKQINMLVILRAIADFLKSRGYWPTKAELTRKMGADGVWVIDWYCAANQEVGQVVLHGGKWKERRRIELTARGWQAIKRQPVTPFKHPPGGNARKEMANTIAKEVERMRLAALNPGMASDDVEDTDG